MSQTDHYDVVIIGAGLAGCATAAALSRADPLRQRRILLVDKCTDVHPRFSGEFIHPRGAQVLRDIGFYEALVDAGAIDVDGFAAFEHADAQLVDLAYDKRGYGRGLSVHHKVLVRVMRKVLRERAHVTLYEGATILELKRNAHGAVDGVVLEGPSGNRRDVLCDLVVGADGKTSAVRKLAGISDQGRTTIGFTAGIEVRDASLPRHGYAHVMLGAWGPVLAYPILRNADGSVTTRVTFDLPRVLPAKGQRLKEHLLRAYVPFLPTPLSSEIAAALINHQGNLEIAPTINLPGREATLPGLALVGDAAGCSHPITASGMTMGLRDAESLGEQARRRAHVGPGEPWIDGRGLKRYRADHDRYVPTRQALADAIYEAFRGSDAGTRTIRRALFDYWTCSQDARARSMALLSCSEGRPSVFLREYLRTARCALEASLVPRHARHFPMGDRVRMVAGTARVATDKLGLVAQVMWAQIRPSWLPRDIMPTDARRALVSRRFAERTTPG